MSYIFYILFALAPSVIWLLFFLRKDRHPESHRMILTVFFLGVLVAIPAAFFEMGILGIIQQFIASSGVIFSLFSVFLGVSLTEEFSKYAVVKFKVLKNSEMDEPVDIVMYMIVAALGFAATENILYLTGAPTFELMGTATVSAFRFVGATFLHALCSGALGYFIALSYRFIEKRKKYLFFGLILVVFLHGIYNLSIMNIESPQKFIIPALILAGLAIFIHWGLHKLKRTKSVCKIN